MNISPFPAFSSYACVCIVASSNNEEAEVPDYICSMRRSFDKKRLFYIYRLHINLSECLEVNCLNVIHVGFADLSAVSGMFLLVEFCRSLEENKCYSKQCRWCSCMWRWSGMLLMWCGFLLMLTYRVLPTLMYSQGSNTPYWPASSFLGVSIWWYRTRDNVLPISETVNCSAILNLLIKGLKKSNGIPNRNRSLFLQDVLHHDLKQVYVWRCQVTVASCCMTCCEEELKLMHSQIRDFSKLSEWSMPSFATSVNIWSNFIFA